MNAFGTHMLCAKDEMYQDDFDCECDVISKSQILLLAVCNGWVKYTWSEGIELPLLSRSILFPILILLSLEYHKHGQRWETWRNVLRKVLVMPLKQPQHVPLGGADLKLNVTGKTLETPP